MNDLLTRGQGFPRVLFMDPHMLINKFIIIQGEKIKKEKLTREGTVEPRFFCLVLGSSFVNMRLTHMSRGRSDT